MKKKTVGEFLKAQDCLFVKKIIDNKVYFCEYEPVSIAWYGKPVEVGVKFKNTCIITELDETTVIKYDGMSPYASNTLCDTSDFAIALWENAHNMSAEEYIDMIAKIEWEKACEEE